MTGINKLFLEPRPQSRPLRVLVYGKAKTGKSHFIFTATEAAPLYWMDTENGSTFYDHSAGHGFRVLLSTDPAKMLEAINLAGQVKGDTLPVVAVDSMSSIWFAQQEVAERLSKGRRASFSAWGPAKKPLKRVYDAVMKANCHVIFTARSKPSYDVDEKGAPTEVGTVPDIERGLPYAVDLILESNVVAVPGKPPNPDDFTLTIVGTRSSDHLPIGTILKNPRFAELLTLVRHGARYVPDDTEEEVVDGQVTAAQFKTWADLAAWIKKLGRDEETAKSILREKFGRFDATKCDTYYFHLGAHYKHNPLADPPPVQEEEGEPLADPPPVQEEEGEQKDDAPADDEQPALAHLSPLLPLEEGEGG